MVILSRSAPLIYEGDCLEILRSMPSGLADLVYLDPPFRSNREYWLLSSQGEVCHFSDRWDSLQEYLAWIEDRIVECKRVLKGTGSIFLHSDSHSSHYLKVMMDRVFGLRNFRNEVIWKRQSKHNDTRQGAKIFGKVHDTILFYSKSRNYKWHPQYLPYSPEYISRTYRFKEFDTGRRYALGDLTGPGGGAKGCPRYKFLGFVRYWRYSKRKALKLHSEGRIMQTQPATIPKLKRYLDEMKGVEVQDIWDDIKPIGRSKERVNYPTQKPEKLLERIITACTDPADVVLDPFCGCGTAVVAAQKLGRRSVGVDLSPAACRVIQRRLASIGVDVVVANKLREGASWQLISGKVES